ncbi:MAG: FkbM family methyltransferase [Verrucomicrobia bacterium]|nr:FkbM family methyltransferase [Verrucomicrobiota bacterium]
MNTLGEIITSLPLIKEHHNHGTSIYRVFEKIARQESEKMFDPESTGEKSLGPVGAFSFPYFKMGAIDSIDLFGLDELILFSFYWSNRNRYKKVLDIGANIGLHTVVLSKCGYQVKLFEPDPVHFAKLQEILSANLIKGVETHQAAVSNRSGQVEFVRVLGNTTSSHIAGCKQPYGDLERFQVPVFDFRSLIRQADLIKMDVEGHEATLIEATSSEDWNSTDAVIEVGAPDKAEPIFSHLQKIGVSAFSQKIGWKRVDRLEDMPFSYRDGSLFISKKKSMPWGE